MMTKLLIGLLGAGVIATGGYAAATGLETDPARTVSLPGATSTEDTATTTRPHDNRRSERHLRPVRRGRAPERSALHRRERAGGGTAPA